MATRKATSFITDFVTQPEYELCQALRLHAMGIYNNVGEAPEARDKTVMVVGFRCERCGTVRWDQYDSNYDLVGRKYAWPRGYRRGPDDSKPTARDRRFYIANKYGGAPQRRTPRVRKRAVARRR